MKSKKFLTFVATAVMMMTCIPANIAMSSMAENSSKLFSGGKKTAALNYSWHIEPSVEADDILVYDIEDEGYFEHQVSKECAYIYKNGKWGIVDYDNNYLAKPEYSDKVHFSGLGLAVGSGSGYDSFVVVHSGDDGLSIDNQYGGRGYAFDDIYYVSDTGQLWVSNSLTPMHKISDTSNNYTVHGYYDEGGTVVVREVLKPEYDANGNLSVDSTMGSNVGKYGLANKTTDKVNCTYENCRNFFDDIYGMGYKNEFCAMYDGSKWAYFDSNGKQITDFIYDPCFELYGTPIINRDNVTDYKTVYLPTEGYIPVKTEDGYGYIDTEGNEVVPIGTFADVKPVHNSFAWVQDKDTELWGVIDFTGSSETAPESKPETVPDGKTEDELKSAVSNYGYIASWNYHDYDNDGDEEAFAIVTKESSGDLELIGTYFIDSAGNIEKMPDNFKGWYYTDSASYYTTHGKGFFSFNCGAMGSGWETPLYSVKNGTPYELDIAKDLQGFNYDEVNDVFYTTLSDFSNGYHEYPEYALIYDEESQQFLMGDRYEVGVPLPTTTPATTAAPTTTVETTTTVTTDTADTTNTDSSTDSANMGDVNQDGMIDASDASQILGIYAVYSTGGTPDATDEQLALADVNGDGMADAADASIVLAYYAYISTGGTEDIGYLLQRMQVKNYFMV